MKAKVSTLLAEHFMRWGVTDVFGIPGKAVCPLLFELQKAQINFVTSRHESGAGFEAAGFALTRKTLGVAIGTSGPGGSNMITSAGQAKAYHLPVLFITGHPPIQATGMAQGQDSSPFSTDLVKMFEPVTLFSARVERSELFPMYLRHALEKALTGTKGPVHLCIPFDVYTEQIEAFEMPLPLDIPMQYSELEEVAAILDNAKRPVLFLGKGVGIAEAYEEVLLMAEHWRMPVITSPCGKGAFPSVHPLSLGGFGLGGTDRSTEYLSSGTDVMVVIGSKLSDMSLSGYTAEMHPRQLIHFEKDRTYTGKSIPVPTKVVMGDAKLNLRKLLNLVNAKLRDYQPGESSLASEEPKESGLISSRTAVRRLRDSLPEDAVLFGDDGSHTFFAIRHYDIFKPGTFFFDDVFGAMGHAIGYSIGAKLGNPEKTIVCLTGDGCIMMHGAEIATAVNHRIPVIFIVLNNGRLDMVDKGMSVFTGRSVGSVYETPMNVAQFAQSLGAQAFLCGNDQEIADAVRIALASNVPTVVEVLVDPLEVPPILTRALTFA